MSPILLRKLRFDQMNILCGNTVFRGNIYFFFSCFSVSIKNMQVLTVAPVVRGTLQGTLTYFSKEPIAIGSVIIVPIRTREVPAIVIESTEVSNAKSTLKSSDYVIRKVANSKPRNIWLPEFLRATEETSRFFAQKFGETLLLLTPKLILDAHINGELNDPEISSNNNQFEALAVQCDARTRIETYQRLVRESFARLESVFICVPTEEDVDRVTRLLSHGIEDYVFSFHSSFSKKRIIERWKEVTEKNHAVLVVGTAQYLAIPRYFKIIILDEEHSPAWRTMNKPYMDLRMFVEEYARSSKSLFIVGASILRAETHERIANGTIGEYSHIFTHALNNIKTLLVDPRVEEKLIKESTGRKGVIVISKETQELIKTAITQNEKVFLLAARKGLAPITTCSDCGALVCCPQCDTPLVIHRIRGGASLRALTTSNTTGKMEESISSEQCIYICHGCGFTRVPENNVNETCPNCGGWKLQGIGIGIDRIDDEITKLFPDTPRFILDSNRAKTRAQAKKIITQFEKSQGAILIATPMAISLLGTVDNTVIISIDSLFAIPDIRMSERIFALILALREKTTKKLLIQTRANDTAILNQALSGDLADFSKNELDLRKTFSYPPYGTIIKITLHGKRDDLTNEIERLKAFLVDYAPLVPGAMMRETKNIFRMHIILKLTEGTWPNKELLAKLRVLPPQFTIEVNPDNLL